MTRVMVIYGTRPEAIKVAPLVLALRADPDLRPIVTVTGQHREMLDQVNALFGIVPDHDLNLMRPGATVAEIGAASLSATGQLLAREPADVVVVQGDTTTAFMAGLAGFYAGSEVVHLEAGLRTGTIRTPFPEESNRRLLAPVADLHLAPTPRSAANLLAEGIAADDVVVTGNTVIDALHLALEQPLNAPPGAWADHDGPLLLVTAHRRESWGEPMRRAMTAVRDLAVARPELGVVLPMHRNPVVREVIEPLLGGLPNVWLTEPQDYHAFCHLMADATIVLTDSGGVQEEAPALGKPVLVMRESTERPEAVDAGTVQLVGTDTGRIVSEVTRLLDDDGLRQSVGRRVNPYGDGSATPRCVAAIRHLVGVGERLPDFRP